MDSVRLRQSAMSRRRVAGFALRLSYQMRPELHVSSVLKNVSREGSLSRGVVEKGRESTTTRRTS
ncbi:hypothetical protein NSPZN2_10330 [Nitrospira defluvii]|uniref:Uncharacterized protein n=1 Tax=Nitrospira defluvii TaxID=330214 RepID=A0ABM8QES6_9BACT|nr:hypothetical protein NSPZN2_10330 [Nitrospira defluvii]